MLNIRAVSLTAAGRIRRSAADPTVFNGGTPVSVLAGVSRLAVLESGPGLFFAGLPYIVNTTNHSVAMEIDGAIARYSVGGLPLNASNSLVGTVADPVSYAPGGIPIAASGAIAVDVAE